MILVINKGDNNEFDNKNIIKNGYDDINNNTIGALLMLLSCFTLHNYYNQNKLLFNNTMMVGW